jgi:hypothetical protein
VISITLGVLAGILASALVAVAKKLIELLRHRRKFGHLYSLTSGVSRIQVVVPSLEAPVFIPQGVTEAARVPKNVKVMPMAEGTAIAELLSVLHGLGRGEIQLVSQENYQDNAGLTVSVGGPSLNSVSRSLLQNSFPKFSIKYPAHVASYGSTVFAPLIDSEGNLTEDYGFAAVGRTSGGNRCIVLCGVWAFGTQIATTSLLRLPLRSDARRLFARKESFFIVSYGRVEGLWPGDIQVVEIRRDNTVDRQGAGELAKL